MKTKKFSKKLSLNKKTIANLGHGEKKKILAGYITYTCGYGGQTCPGEYTCDGGYTCDVGCTQTCNTCDTCVCPQPTRKFEDTCRPLCPPL
jgi:hypothetical protein